MLGCAAVPRVTFTTTIQRHVSCPPETVEGHTVREALEHYFARHPRVRSYVVDEQGALRQHVVVFVNGNQVRDRTGQQDALRDDAELYVMQALSGG